MSVELLPGPMEPVLHIKRKVVLAGDASVGKTSLIRRFVDDYFDEEYMTTIGTTIYSKKLEFPGVHLTLLIWDLAGQIEMHGVQRKAFQNARGALVVTDLSEPKNREREAYWSYSIMREAGPIPMVICGNKVDLVEDEIEAMSDLRGFGSVMGYDVLATSAKTGANVEAVFNHLGQRVLEPLGVLDEGQLTLLWASRRGVTREERPEFLILDRMIVGYVELFDDQEFAMLLMRKQFARIGMNPHSPTTQEMGELVKRLVVIAREYVSGTKVESWRDQIESLLKDPEGD